MVKLNDYQKCLKRHSTKKPRTKAQFRKIQKMCKSKKPRTRKGGKHHKTTRGLAQDQRLKSKEKHEVAYQKGKRKGKR